MNERKFDAGSLAEQIDSAKKNLESWPEWLKESAKFQGQNHAFDTCAESDHASASDDASKSSSEE